MYLEELIDLVAVTKLSITLLEMLNLVETCVVNLWDKTLLWAVLYSSHKLARSLLFANISLKRVRHRPDTVIS